MSGDFSQKKIDENRFFFRFIKSLFSPSFRDFHPRSLFFEQFFGAKPMFKGPTSSKNTYYLFFTTVWLLII